MSASPASANSASRFERLSGYLAHDPTNLKLIADAADAAFSEGKTAEAADLLKRYGARGAALPPHLQNLRGLIAMQEQRFEDALALFEPLAAEHGDDPALAFNCAWCRAALKDFAGASATLTDRAAEASAQAAELKVRVLHHLGQLDEALSLGERYAGLYPNAAGLSGLLAAIALDAENLDLAERYARQAGDQYDGLAALGMLELNQDRVDEALDAFTRALQIQPQDARARLGAGLGQLAKGDYPRAAAQIDQAAELFGAHLGSWVAAGWVHLIQGDLATGRARFETALAIDDTFAEIHGGLSVLDLIEGDLESAQRRCDIALRLDRRCFSAALAKVMMLTQAGDLAAAERVRALAMNTPIGPGGRTIAQSIAALGLVAPRPGRRR